MKQVLIVGAGFSGVRLARKLAKQKNVHVTLLNDAPDFRYYPALYRSAVGENMSTSVIALDWMILGLKNVDLVIGKAVRLDAIKKSIFLEDGSSISYDELALALGSVTTFFNIEGLHERAYGIKSAEEIIELREHIESMLKSADRPEQNYVIAGGGPTGVELAASLGGYIQMLERKYKVKNHKVKIWLVEGADRLLPTMRRRSSAFARKRLEKIGINVLLSTKVTSENARGLQTSFGFIATHTVIWTAGTACNPFFAENADIFKRNERGRVVVNHHLQTHPSIYVIGDNAAVQYAGLAFTAIRHADYVAKDMKNRQASGKRQNHKPVRPPVVIPVGRHYAVFEYGPIVLGGRIISYLRSIADLVGYTDIMGVVKAYSIWSNSR